MAGIAGLDRPAVVVLDHAFPCSPVEPLRGVPQPWKVGLLRVAVSPRAPQPAHPGRARSGLKPAASSPNTVWSRFTDSRSSVIRSPLAICTPLDRSMSASAQRIPVGLEGWSRMVSWVHFCTKSRSSRTRSR